jgi:conjugal transfer pilus assembly protein TraW
MVFLVLMLFIWSVDAVSFDYSEIKKPDKKMCDETKSILNIFQRPDIEAANSAASTFRNPRKIEITGDTAGNTAIYESSGTPPYAVYEDTLSSQDRMYYFFSFSMPQGILEDAVNDAIRLRKEGIDVVLALRGLVRNDFKSTIRTFYTFMKENGLNDFDLPVELHPQLFSTYAVSRVPHVVYESVERTGSISGVSISHALSKFRKEVKDYGKYGTTYQIEEENLLEVIEARLKSPDFQERIKRMLGKAKDKMYKFTKYDGMFSRTKEDNVYRIDPALTLDEDILDHEGNVIFAKGSTFNPADFVPLTGRYIFIDGNDEKQVSYALGRKFKKIILTAGDFEELTRKHRHRFYLVNDDLIEKIRLTHVPAILEQEGRHLRVTEKALN